MDAARQEITRLLTAINDAWVQGKTGELHNYFHENMVIAGPDATKMGEGREACVGSYKDFMDNAHVASFTAGNPDIDVWGNTAVAFYQFEILYRMHGKEYHETGRDVFAFTREAESAPWLAVWRMLIPIEAHKG